MIKKIIHKIFEKNGFFKLTSALLSTILLLVLFRIFDSNIFLYISYVPGTYLSLYFIITLSYAWVINPLNQLKEKKKKK